MRLSNGLFAEAVNYLIDNNKVRDQQELSSLTGITETTISRIMNDKVKQPSAETLQKLYDAFPGFFNPKYFRGENAYMLMQDYIEAQQKKNSSPQQQTANIIEVCTQMVCDIEKLHRELKEEIEAIRKDRQEARELITNLHDCLFYAREGIRSQEVTISRAADDGDY